MEPGRCDVLIVGGGPAGLTAGVYVGRYRRSVVLVDDDRSRAATIPVSRNCPGFAGGISGPDLLRELRLQCLRHGVELRSGFVNRLQTDGTGFLAHTSAGPIQASAVILATGIVDRLPPMEGARDAIRDGRIRLCPICDAFEAAERRVGVFGTADQACAHARYLRSFSRHVLVASTSTLDAITVRQLRDEGIDAIGDAVRCSIEADHVRIDDARGNAVHVDTLYPMLGCDPNTALARQLGVRCAQSGCVDTDTHQRTSVPGVYAIGDVVEGLVFTFQLQPIMRHGASPPA